MRSRELMIRVVDRLVSAIRKAAEYNSASQVAPCCILWPDGDRQFESAVPLLLKEIPNNSMANWVMARMLSKYSEMRKKHIISGINYPLKNARQEDCLIC